MSEISVGQILQANIQLQMGKRFGDYRKLKDVVCMICGTSEDEFDDRAFISELKKCAKRYAPNSRISNKYRN